MTKAELIRKIAKNVGVPDSDAKIFFELFLKRISAVVDIGQSIFVKDFGYFHLIRGRIKKPVFSLKDNEISEEEVDLVLFSEDIDLRKSDTKGLVFNIPIFDEEDYHPIDSSFSLSIGKPLIPLRGVPFDNIYIPTSGYEYRRLIESKVEKIIGASDIAVSEENFPILVIDARSYNSNQAQLQWDDKPKTETPEQVQSETELETETQNELSEYEKQAKELKNIAWDFGEDLSRQIEAESILDITDERISMDLNLKANSNKEPEFSSQEINEQYSTETSIIPEKNITDEKESIEEPSIEDSSEKLNELLESESVESVKEEIIIETINDINDEINIYDEIEEVKPEGIEINAIEDEILDKEFWESTSKYFEPYKPETQKISEEELATVNSTTNFGDIYSDTDNIEKINEPEDISISLEKSIENEVHNGNVDENTDEDKNVTEDSIELEDVAEQKLEFYKSEKKRNLIPFIVFPLLVIIVSVALYWYLEFYKKGENKIKPAQIVLKSDNAKVVSRNFDLPVTYPYLPKVSQTTISEMGTQKIDEPNETAEKIEDKNIEQKKVEEKKTEKDIPKQKIVESREPVKSVTTTSKGLNVGNNIFKYGNYYTVQVASFRASSISKNEAGKYRDRGYNAFVEAAEIPNRGTWYRVRVGNFSTKEEAQNFLSKNIR